MNSHDAYLNKKFSGKTLTEDSQGKQVILKWQSIDGIVEILAAQAKNTGMDIPFINFSLKEIAFFQAAAEQAAQTNEY